MSEHTKHEKVAEHEPDFHVMLVPEYLRDQVEEHIRHLEDEENDVSGYMGIKLIIHPPAPPRRVSTQASSVQGAWQGGTDQTTDICH